MTKPNSQWVEEVAAIQHDQWSGWMEYLFSKCNDNIDRFSLEPDGQFIIPAWAVERWKRQLLTKYEDLSEEEKESDRKEAERYRDLLQAHAKEQVETFIEGLVKEYEKLVTMLTEKGWDKGDDFQQGQFSMAKNVLAESRTLLRKHIGEEK